MEGWKVAPCKPHSAQQPHLERARRAAVPPGMRPKERAGIIPGKTSAPLLESPAGNSGGAVGHEQLLPSFILVPANPLEL